MGQLDIRAIALPTDHITLGAVRRVECKRVGSIAGEIRSRMDETEAVNAMYLEAELCDRAFGRALGRTESRSSLGRADYVDALHSVYRKYGLALSREETETLISSFEKSAASQAARGRGR